MSTSQEIIVITDKYNNQKRSIKISADNDSKNSLKIIRAALELFIQRCADNKNDAIFKQPSIVGYRKRVESEIIDFLASDEDEMTVRSFIIDFEKQKEHGVEVRIERMTTHQPAYL